MTRKEAAKVNLLPVPPGHKIKYQHCYKTTDGEPLYKDSDGNFRIITRGQDITLGDDITSDPIYTGTRKLFGTDAVLENAAGITVAMGSSSVNPKDTPNKKLGRAIAHNRCIKGYIANA